MKLNRITRKLHFWGALGIFVPVFIVIVSGLLLQVKKEVEWIQPSTMKGSGFDASSSLQQILDSVHRDANNFDAESVTWESVDRFDIRPSKNIAKVRLENGWEYQVDLSTFQVLKKAQRNSDWIEALHDGSWFHTHAKLWVFLPVAVVLLILWLTGGYLLFITLRNKRRAKLKHGR